MASPLPFSPSFSDAIALPESDFQVSTGVDRSRQLKNLLLVRPLFELALRMRRTEEGDRLFSGIDTNYLSVSLLDFVMEGGVFGFGRSREEVLTYLGEKARLLKPSLSEVDSRKVAADVVDALHNAENRSERFEYEYFDSVGGEMKRYAFHLLRWTRCEDDRSYYRVTDEGHLVYLGMLDLGTEDMQVLLDKMLAELIRRGRVEQALDVSERGRREAMRYRDSIRTYLERAQRSPDSVTWKGDLEPFLEHSREHIDGRHKEEQQLQALVNDQLREATDLSARKKFVRLHETLEQELSVHLRLLLLVTEAGSRFRHAQKTMFRARRRQKLPDIEEQLLPPLLAASVQNLADISDSYSHVFLSPETPKQFSLGHAVSLLTELRRTVEPQAWAEENMVPLDKLPAHFQDDVVEAAKAHVEQALREAFAKGLSIDNEQILLAGEAKNLSAATQEYAMHRLYELFSDKNAALNVEKSGRFRTQHVAGERLVYQTPDVAFPENNDD
jgi:hypothetical protein